MAIAIPILMSVTGASAAISAAIGVSAITAGVVTAGAGVLAAATGVGSKINKAASKVFGEDLVNAANMVGGVAFAAGWNPGDGLGSFNAWDGAASAGSKIDPAALNTTPSGLTVPPPGAGGMDGSHFANANAAPQGMPAASPINKAVGAFNSLGDRSKAALIIGAGQLVAGVGQGYSKGKEIEDAKEERLRREAGFMSGSGTKFTYKPGVLSRVGG